MELILFISDSYASMLSSKLPNFKFSEGIKSGVPNMEQRLKRDEIKYERLRAKPKSVKNVAPTFYYTHFVHLPYLGIWRKKSTEYCCKALSPRDLSDLSQANGE